MKTKPSKRDRRSPRMRTLDYSEPYVYSITTCTHGRRNLFADRKLAEMVIPTLMEFAKRYDIVLHAFCIMPDHLHVVAQPQGLVAVPRYVKSIKGKTTYLMHGLGFSGKVWQRSFFDHVVRISEGLETVVRYVLENPVRKGLVDHFTDHKLSWDRFGIKESAAQARGQCRP